MNDDFFELPSQDIDLTDNKGKQNRKKAIDEILKIFDNEKIQYDLVPDAKRKFINNQIGILGDYKLFISVDPNTDMKKLCSYLNKELIKYGCHVSRDNYNTLTLSYDKSLLVKEQEMRNYDTIVFDIGGVLIEREEIDLRDLRKLGIYDEVELRQLMIIYYDIANENDTATYKEVLEKYEKALPDRFKPKAKELIDLSMHKRVCKYTVPLLKELKSKGYKLYYLSNASKHRHEVSKKKGLLNFLEYFDGGLISYKEGVEKPNPEFYNRLLKKYKLKASDCLFIDDNSSNIETAQNLGFKTLYYNNPKSIDLYSIIESAELELPEDEVVNEACKDVSTARRFVSDVRELAKKYDANFFVVTDGASGYSNGNGENNPAVKNARAQQIEWEKKNGFDPDEDWEKKPVNETLELPEDNNTLEEILNNTDPNNIYFTSDWHLFKNHYKHEANYVNTQKIIAWCRQNIKDNDVFFYLGDISFRWANEEDQKESMKIMASLPGIKILILGNHDKMLGQDYFANCGFKYVFEEYTWKDYIFTHRPINMDSYPENMLNIHGHIHNIVKYNTTDGKRNVNVYPMYYDNKPVTLNYITSHIEELTKDHEWNWNVGYSESALLEGILLDNKDIEYNIDKFKNGDINFALVVGFSGSGKSTLGRNLAKSPDTEHYELDDLMSIWNFTDENLREYGDLIYSFFKGVGKKYRVTEQYLIDNKMGANKYEIPLLRDFLKYTENYAKSHKNNKYVLDGVWPLLYNFDPANYKDWCVIIKGTSFLNSEIRAVKRDYKYSEDSISKFAFEHIKDIPNRIDMSMLINKGLTQWVKYFDKLTVTESKRSELPDSSFGIPEDRKYPLDTEQHVKSAIKLFGHAEESKKKSLAKRINAAAKKYDISIPENTQCYKYLSEGGFYDMIPEDINTIVFDMGGVLVNSDIEGTIHNGLHVSHLLAHEIQDLILDNILCCEPKDKRIKTCSLDYIKKYFYNIAPDNIKPYTDDILRLFNNALFKYAYVDELIDMLKSKGYSIYYLSNWFGWSYELEKEFFAPLLSKFDGGLFSFETNYEKPQEEFYRIFFNKFNLDPKTCLFFDDKAENISAGERLGMRGIIFNPEETPKQLLDGNFNIPSDANNKILISTGVNLEAVDISQIHWWHCSKYNNLNDFDHYDNNEFYRTIDEAIKKNTIKSDYTNGPIERYLYSYTGDIDEDYCQKFIVGAIQINPDYTYEWTIQYPLESDKDGNLTSGLSEWAMASCNPIKGISKPYILKITPDNNSTINPKLYAFSPDIISDKYLVVNENAELEIVDADRFNDCLIESYEFIGDNQDYLLSKIYKAYKEHKIVDNTFFYTTLTGKPMLCEDQIDYDSLFYKVDIDLMIENINTEMATVKRDIMDTIYSLNTSLPVLEGAANSVSFIKHYNHISIKEDIDGYYFINNLNNRRSRSEKNIHLLTEAMLKSTL